MFTSTNFSNLFLALPTVLVLIHLPHNLVAADVEVEEQEELEACGFVSAVAEGVMSLCAFSAVIIFNSLRSKKSGVKAGKRFDKLGYEYTATEKPTERTRKEKSEVTRTKKASTEMSAEALQIAAERARLTELVHQFSKSGNMQRANKALTMLEDIGGTPSLSEYSTVITMCAKASDADGAHAWVRRLQEKGLVPNAVCFNAVINAHAKLGDADKAVAVAEEMSNSGVDFDTVTYNTLIDACTRKGDAVQAQLWMKKMLAAGVKASVVSFGSVMRACAKAGLNDDLNHWVEQADALGIELNMICFSAVINGFAKNGDIDSADYWLARMTACNINPSVHCFTGMVDAVLKNGDIDRATRIMGRMFELDVEPDAGIYSWLVTAACQTGRPEDAQKWINEASASGIQLNRQAKSALFAAKLTIPSDAPSGKPSSVRTATNKVTKAEPVECIVDKAEAQACIGKRFVGTVKEYISAKFGYIVCEETHAVFKRDIFLSSQDNPEQFAKGQKVTFVLQVDRRRGLPRACDLKVFQK